MVRTWFAGVLGALLVGGLPTAVVLVATDQSDNKLGTTHSTGVGTAPANESAEPEPAEADEDAKAGDDEPDKGGRESGPPPWAHSAGPQGHRARGADASWKDAWRELTPAQRARKMEAFAKAHAEGMHKWTRCIVAAGNDSTKQAACEKPLPPGLAKKQP